MWKRFAAFVPIVVLALLPANVRAEIIDTQQATANVGSTAAGPVITQGSASYNPIGTQAAANSRADQPGAPAAAGSVASASSSDVTYGPIPHNAVPVAGAPWVDQSGIIHVAPPIPASACPAGQTGYYAYDPTGAILGVVCVGNGAPPPGAPAPSPLELAQQASAAQPWPVLQFGINPATGLTGLPSWFWLAGSPQMPDAAASAGPLTVRVHATLIDVDWNFGDGGGLSSGTNVGQPFPATGGIQHVYETDTFGRPGGYILNALLRYEVTYSVNGGPFSVLGIKARPFVTTYQVNQLQPEAVSAR
jgi:hypothetical protein